MQSKACLFCIYDSDQNVKPLAPRMNLSIAEYLEHLTLLLESFNRSRLLINEGILFANGCRGDVFL